MRCECGYKLINGTCPICGGRQIKGLEPKAHIPRSLRGFTVAGHFESLRHYYAWRAGVAIEAGKGRREIPQRTKDLIFRQFGRRCQWAGGCDTGEAPTVEHIVPVAFGGSNHPGNLSVLCPTHQRASWARFQQLLSVGAA
jgi:hypothetical protein